MIHYLLATFFYCVGFRYFADDIIEHTGEDVPPGHFIHSNDVAYRFIEEWVDVPVVTITEGDE